MLRKPLQLLFGILLFAGAARAAAPTVVTVAGADWTFPTGPLSAAEAPLGKATGLAVDSENNVYIADADNHMVFKVTPQRVLTVVAGNGQTVFAGDGGPATQAALADPQGVAVDRNGVLYIADSSRVRRVAPDGTITTMAGPFSSLIRGMAVDFNGNVYTCEWLNYRIRKIASDGTSTVVAGNGTRGFTGDGGKATDASLAAPYGVAVDAAGNLYVADGSSARVRKVDAAGIITSIAGGGVVTPDQVLALTCYIGSPAGIAADASGNVFFTSTSNQLYKVTPDGMIWLLAGDGGKSPWQEGGPAQLAPLYTPGAVAVDSVGNVYVADQDHRRVRLVDSQGMISTFAGNGAFSYGGDGGAATEAALAGPSGIVLDAGGNLYFCDGEWRIRRIDRQGVVTTVAGAGKGNWGDMGPAIAAGLDRPRGLALDHAGNLYLADAFNQRIRRISPDGNIVTVAAAGLVREAGATTVPAVGASLSVYDGVAVDADGNIYFTDRYGNRIRKVSKEGTIRTIAGTGTAGFSGDGGPADKAQVNAPGALALDAAGNLYFYDSGNFRVRRVGVEGAITTIAGNGKPGFSDGGPAVEASFGTTVNGLAVDNFGVVYVADSSNNRVRLLFTDGTTLTLAGGGTSREEGAEAHNAILDSPGGLAVAADGTVYVALEYRRKIKAIVPAKQE